MSFRSFFSFVCIFSSLLSAKAQEQADSTLTGEEIDEVVVTGNNTVTRTSAPVRIITTHQKERLGITDISDALKRTAGVDVKDYGGVGGLKTVSVRGLGSQHTAVSYDGIILSDCQNGQIDLSRYSMDNIDKMTLTIGEGNEIFRPARHFAAATRLDLYTATPNYNKEKQHLRMQVKTGSFGLVNPYFWVDKKIGKKNWASFSSDFLRSDGRYPFTLTNGKMETREKRENSEVESGHCEANFNSQLTTKSQLNVKVYFYNSDREIPGSIILYNTNNKEELEDQNFFTQVRFRTFMKSKLSLMINGKFNWAATRYHDEKPIYASGEINDSYFQREYYASAAVFYQPARVMTFSFASDYAHNGLNANTYNFAYPKRHSILNVLNAQFSNYRFTATATGLYSIYINEVEEGTTPDNYKRLSPSLSLSYRPFKPDFRIRASYKDNFRMPTFNELYFDRTGAKNLSPERARQFNVGFTYSCSPSKILKELQFTADGYHNKVKDKIVALPRMFSWSMLNMGEVEMNGADFHASATISPRDKYNFFVYGNCSLLKAVDYTSKETRYYGDQIPYTPRRSGGGSIAFENPFLNISYQITAISVRYCFPEASTENRIDPYTEHGLSFYHDFPLKKVILSMRGDIVNFTDCQYEVIKYYPMPGRSYRLTLSLKTKD